MKEERIWEQARAIVERFHQRDALPRLLTNRDTPEKEQEFKDAQKLKNWKKYLNKKKGGSHIPDSIVEYLDDEMSGWRDWRGVSDAQDTPMAKATGIVKRYRARGYVLPKEGSALSFNAQDVSRLRQWLSSLEKGEASESVLKATAHVDASIPGWRKDIHCKGYNAKAIFDAILLHEARLESIGIGEREFCKWFVKFQGFLRAKAYRTNVEMEGKRTEQDSEVKLNSGQKRPLDSSTPSSSHEEAEEAAQRDAVADSKITKRVKV